MSNNIQIKIRNFKCFSEAEQGFNSIRPFNIIIGKNNAGKSSLIELIEQIIEPKSNFYETGKAKQPEIIIQIALSEHSIRRVFDEGTKGGSIPKTDYNNHYAYGKDWIGTGIKYSLLKDGTKALIGFEKDFLIAKDMGNQLIRHIQNPLMHKNFKRISSERDVIPESESYPPNLTSKGEGATNFIQIFINRSEFESRVVEKQLLREINKVLNPEINFTNISIQKHGGGLWEIYFESKVEDRIPLSKMGSGVKTILLVLINLHLIPILEKKEKSEYVFAFEELENNLHPSLQRKLFSYIREYAENTNALFFLTTHSNVVIDLFANDDQCQILHVKNGLDSVTTVDDVTNYTESKKVLEDLDIRASDLLQSNGVIWVEGPSDRVYINRWLELFEPRLKEGVHYSIMFYGGRLLKRVHFLPDFLEQELIPILRINQNAYVVIDRDGRNVTAALNETKLRIQKEIGKESCWITLGREIENYLPKSVIEKWLKEKHKVKTELIINKFEKFEDSISNVSKIKYDQNKVKYSNEISKLIGEDNLGVLDLRTKIEQIVIHIKRWNRM
jgi:putative ATP-dependent endonuclease of OLD family